ncbi:MAG TPA: hypothetical protein PK447_08375 [Ignavibacteria bacterium]|nr:hypothetical protein [Ignavibacteria bacterium]
MKYALPVILILILITGCSSETGSLKKKLEQSDKAIIYFYDKMTGSPYAVCSIENKDTVQMILAGVSEEDTPVLKCGYTGAIEFFNNSGSLMNLEFNIEKGCEHIVFMMNSNSWSKKLTSPALEVLDNLYSISKIK